MHEYYAFRIVKDKLIVPSIHDSIYIIRLKMILIINPSLDGDILLQIYIENWNDEITSNQVMQFMGHSRVPKPEEPIIFVAKNEFLLRHNVLPVVYRAKSYPCIVLVNMVLLQSIHIVYHYSWHLQFHIISFLMLLIIHRNSRKVTVRYYNVRIGQSKF